MATPAKRLFRPSCEPSAGTDAKRWSLQSASPGAPHDARLGAVSFLHRFGSALNPQTFELRSKVSRTASWVRDAPRPLGRSAPLPPRGPRRRLPADPRRHDPLLRGHPARPTPPARSPACRSAPRAPVLPHARPSRRGRCRRHAGHPPQAGRAGVRRVSFAELAEGPGNAFPGPSALHSAISSLRVRATGYPSRSRRSSRTGPGSGSRRPPTRPSCSRPWSPGRAARSRRRRWPR